MLLPAQNPNRDQVAKPPTPNPLLPPETALKRDLRLSIGDGAAYGVMVGVGETYLQTFVLEIGKGEIFAALIATVPQLIGSLLQLMSPTAVRMMGSHKWWVVLCAGFQGLCFIPLILAAWFGSISEPAVLLVASLYWATSLGAGPAWNTWQGTIVPRDIRARFFAKRARLCQLATLAGFLGGGFALKWARLFDFGLDDDSCRLGPRLNFLSQLKKMHGMKFGGNPAKEHHKRKQNVSNMGLLSRLHFFSSQERSR
ncbi:MAG: hypothetical protein WCH39_27515 [Schlesneria sp.]